jgi:hypothetical protein
MKWLGCALVVAGLTVAASAQTGTQKFQGHLVDTVCADGHATEEGYAEKHERKCNLMDVCVKSGYSLMTADKKVLHLDAKGAEQALALVKSNPKEKDFRVTITGKMDGPTLVVQSITAD